MKKNLFIGLGLLGVAFSGAAFTANKAMQSNHYVQNGSTCAPIPLTNCVPDISSQCRALDPADPGSGLHLVFESALSSSQCQTPLGRPNN